MAKKVSKRKIPKKRKKKDKKEEVREKAEITIKKRQLVNISLTVLLVIVVVGTGLMIYANSIQVDSNTPSVIKRLAEFNNNLFPKPVELAAVVNEEELTMAELDERFKLLPAQYQQVVQQEDVLSQMIDETLLTQQAEKNSIIVTDQEVEDRINAILQQNQVTMAQLQQTLQQRDLTVEDLREFYRKEMLLNKLLQQEVFKNLSISDTDIKDFYFSNQEQFLVPEARNVSHILICHNESIRCVSNQSKDEALELALDVREMVNDSNFGELAIQYSDEPISNQTRGNLGLISRETQFDQTFLNATFALDEGEVSSPIETDFGYHLIKVFEVREEDYVELDTIYQRINQTLQAQRQQELYTEYISTLRNTSTIVNYLEEE